MSSSQQNSEETTYGQYNASKAHIEQLVKDHIPHFANLSSKRGGRNKRTLQTSNLGLLQNNGNISERALHENEISIKDKAYNDIQDSRGYNTCAAYRGKQIEFLLFCEQFYASRPLVTRYQASGDKLLTFLYEKVKKKKKKKINKEKLISFL